MIVDCAKVQFQFSSFFKEKKAISSTIFDKIISLCTVLPKAKTLDNSKRQIQLTNFNVSNAKTSRSMSFSKAGLLNENLV